MVGLAQVRGAWSEVSLRDLEVLRAFRRHDNRDRSEGRVLQRGGGEAWAKVGCEEGNSFTVAPSAWSSSNSAARGGGEPVEEGGEGGSL